MEARVSIYISNSPKTNQDTIVINLIMTVSQKNHGKYRNDRWLHTIASNASNLALVGETFQITKTLDGQNTFAKIFTKILDRWVIPATLTKPTIT